MKQVSSDLTCLQALNALTWSFTSKRWDADQPFNQFIEEYRNERRQDAEPPRQPLGNGPQTAAGGLPREAGVPSGGLSESAGRRARFDAEAEAATVTITPHHGS